VRFGEGVVYLRKSPENKPCKYLYLFRKNVLIATGLNTTSCLDEDKDINHHVQFTRS
jgi:hypothetical protein